VKKRIRRKNKQFEVNVENEIAKNLELITFCIL